MKSVDVRRFDLNLLTVLEAIYSAGVVTGAAAKLNLTQPAISHALARLRDRFDDPLFVRQGRNLVPTPLTRGLIEPLRRSLGALNAVLSEGGRFDPRTTRARFSLAMRDPVEVLVAPVLMRAIFERAPLIDLVILQARRRTLEAALASGALDLAIDVPLPLSDAIRRRRVAADRMVVVARRHHPAARRGLDLAAYLAQEHVMVTSRRKGPGLEDLALAQRGVERRVRLRCRSYGAAFRTVSASNLLLTMPERYAGLLDPGLGVRVLPLPLKTPTLDLLLYWHAAVDDDPANRWLRALVGEAFTR